MKNRIRVLIKALGKTQLEFAESIKMTPSYLSQVLTVETRQFGTDVILKIKTSYPSVNLNWLIAGFGEMFVEETLHDNKCPKCKVKDETIAALQRSLKLALDTIDSYNSTGKASANTN